MLIGWSAENSMILVAPRLRAATLVLRRAGTGNPAHPSHTTASTRCWFAVASAREKIRKISQSLVMVALITENSKPTFELLRKLLYFKNNLKINQTPVQTVSTLNP